MLWGNLGCVHNMQVKLKKTRNVSNRPFHVAKRGVILEWTNEMAALMGSLELLLSELLSINARANTYTSVGRTHCSKYTNRICPEHLIETMEPPLQHFGACLATYSGVFHNSINLVHKILVSMQAVPKQTQDLVVCRCPKGGLRCPDSLECCENRSSLRVDSRESPPFALRIAGPSKKEAFPNLTSKGSFQKYRGNRDSKGECSIARR